MAGSREQCMLGQVHARPSETDAFHFQSKALVESALPSRFDLAAGAQYAMPGQRIAASTEYPRHLAMMPRITGRFRDLSISRYFALGNRANHAPDSGLFALDGFHFKAAFRVFSSVDVSESRGCFST